MDLAPEQTSHLFLNEYIYVGHGDFREPARYRGDGQLEALIVGDGIGVKIPKGIRISPLNEERRMLMDALLDEDIKLVNACARRAHGQDAGEHRHGFVPDSWRRQPLRAGVYHSSAGSYR